MVEVVSPKIQNLERRAFENSAVTEYYFAERSTPPTMKLPLGPSLLATATLQKAAIPAVDMAALRYADHVVTPAKSAPAAFVLPPSGVKNIINMQVSDVTIPLKILSSKKGKKGRKDKKLSWEEKFTVLRAFKQVHGHCRVPPGFVVGKFRLGGWVETQRKEYLKHNMGLFSPIINEKRIQRLERAGFEWERDGFGSSFLWTAQKNQLAMV